MRIIFFILALNFANFHLVAQQNDTLFSGKCYETPDNNNGAIFYRDSLQKANNYSLSIQRWLTETDTLKMVEKYYQLAVNYAKMQKQDSAFYYLNNYVKISKDDRAIFVDCAFEELRQNQQEWEALIDNIESLYLAEIQYVTDKCLALHMFYLNISMLKYLSYYQLLDIGNSTPYCQISQNSVKNWELFKDILSKYGFPTKNKVGYLGEQTAYALLYLNRISESFYITKSYYNHVKELFQSGNFDPLAYALITDQYLVGNKKKQIYGSCYCYVRKKEKGKYISYPILCPIHDFTNVNERRRITGFEKSIEEYASEIKVGIPKKYYSK